ncbi:MAG: exosome complex RNA-binding protein Csl4 [Ferroplasma sp.]
MEKNLVFPGEIIAKEEEYVSGRNTDNVNGDVIATAFGFPDRNEKTLTISVNTDKKAVEIKRGDIVYGKIIRIINKEAVVFISGVEKKGNLEKISIESRLKLPVANKAMYSHIVTIGDLIRGRAIHTKPLYITIFEQNLGVLETRCLICRQVLVLRDNKLFCTNCNRNEVRKIAPDYGNINISGVNYERSE